jgi:hypothetical protein
MTGHERTRTPGAPRSQRSIDETLHPLFVAGLNCCDFVEISSQSISSPQDG